MALQRMLSATAFACVLSTGLLTARAADYSVEFDCYDRTDPKCKNTHGVVATLDAEVFNPKMIPWGSYGHSKGSRLLNGSGRTIKGIHIKINGTADTFRVDAMAGGNLFQEVWRKKDGKEAIFNGANVPDNRYFWSRVLPRTPGFPDPYFLGRVSESNIPIPQDGTWEMVHPTAEKRTSSVWKNLVDASPNEYRHIQAYAESTDGKKVLFLSDDVLLLYDDGTKELRYIVTPEVIPHGINRITSETGQAHFS